MSIKKAMKKSMRRSRRNYGSGSCRRGNKHSRKGIQDAAKYVDVGDHRNLWPYVFFRSLHKLRPFRPPIRIIDFCSTMSMHT